MPIDLAGLRKMREGITKGEWKQDGSFIRGFSRFKNKIAIARTTRTHVGRPMSERNATLIAAAPIILDALIEQLEWRESLRGKVEELRESPNIYLDGLDPREKMKFAMPYVTACSDILELINQE